MTLQEFKQHIEHHEAFKTFKFGISAPFSWRGIYSDVAFEILDIEMSREEILAHIEEAYSEEFRGYKGGKFSYNDSTDVHFEHDSSSYTGGGYCEDWISKIEDTKPYRSQEMRLVNIAFS